MYRFGSLTPTFFVFILELHTFAKKYFLVNASTYLIFAILCCKLRIEHWKALQLADALPAWSHACFIFEQHLYLFIYLSYPLHTPVSLNSTLSVHSCLFTDPLHHLPALILYSLKPPSLPSFTPSYHPLCPYLLLQTTLPALIYSFIPPSLLLFTPSYYPHP